MQIGLEVKRKRPKSGALLGGQPCKGWMPWQPGQWEGAAELREETGEGEAQKESWGGFWMLKTTWPNCTVLPREHI